jgi:hypothetical protein
MTTGRVLLVGLLVVVATVVVAPSASAVVRDTEFPYLQGNRICDYRYSDDGVYRFDFCASVGHHGGNAVGQATLACRVDATSALVRCKSMTLNDGRLYVWTGTRTGLARHWGDSVPNVARYVSVPSSSYDCPSSYEHVSTYIAVSARFPDDSTAYGDVLSGNDATVC